METIRIPNTATYFPVGLTDVALAGPLASRILLGATLPGRALQGVALAFYAASAAQDWIERLGVRKIDFLAEYGSNVRHLTPMPAQARDADMLALASRLNDEFTPERPPLREIAVRINRRLTDYISGITDQRVITSSEVRTFSLVQFIFPFALGAADPLSGDVSIFRDTGIFQPHVIAHEFAHRKGYFGELEAQALAYLAMSTSGDPVLVQSARAERLHRNIRALVGDDVKAFNRIVEGLSLRPELERSFLAVRPELGTLTRSVAELMRTAYDLRLKLTGQNGISDYDVGFTNFLYTFERSDAARQRAVPI